MASAIRSAVTGERPVSKRTKKDLEDENTLLQKEIEKLKIENNLLKSLVKISPRSIPNYNIWPDRSTSTREKIC